MKKSYPDTERIAYQIIRGEMIPRSHDIDALARAYLKLSHASKVRKEKDKKASHEIRLAKFKEDNKNS